MNVFSCPCCGPREENEFFYGGEAGSARPEPAATTSDREWAEYLFFRENPKGRSRELWVHAGGCGVWFILERNTFSHEVTNVLPLVIPSEEGTS